MAKYKSVSRKEVKNADRNWFKGQIPCVKKKSGYYYCRMAEGNANKIPQSPSSTLWISNEDHKGRTMHDAIKKAYDAM